jgi:outer membrane receptor for ferrienterochelin and colicin
MLKKKWSIYTAASFSYNKDDINFDNNPLENQDDRSQFRFEAKHYVNARLNILVGGELQHFNYASSGRFYSNNYDQNFSETQAAGYVEVDWIPVYWLAFRPGVRYEHSVLLNQDNISPRLSLAIKAGQNGQFSLASGVFYQNADPVYLLAGYKPKMQQSVHYIANYQFIKGDRTLRLEAYYKDYNQLVREIAPAGTAFDPNLYRVVTPANTPGYSVDNSGYGYAKGIELFWRDKKSIKNFDYWLSYSYIDTRRLYKNFTKEVTPTFIADHNLSVISKYFINDIQTNISATYSYASGRPYYNPLSSVDFMSQRTKDFHNLALTVSWLHTFGKWFTVFYAGVDNLTNSKNVFGKRYDAKGEYLGDQKPALYRSVFVGVNFSLSEFSKDEL